MEALRELDIRKQISLGGLDTECGYYIKQGSACKGKGMCLESEELDLNHDAALCTDTTLWIIKLNNSSLHFLPYKMKLIVFPYSTQKDFAGDKLNKESETAYKTLHHLGFFGYKQQIPSNVNQKGIYWKGLG